MITDEELEKFLDGHFGELRGDDEATNDFIVRLLSPQHSYAPDGTGHCVECGWRKKAHRN